MIIVKLCGGLGNQMFQYAAGRRLASALGVDLKLDTSWYLANKSRTYSLSHLNITGDPASEDEILRLKFLRMGFMERQLRKMHLLSPAPRYAPGYIREKHFHFDPGILSLTDGIYLEGYWQSEKYFIDIDEIIRHEFEVVSPQKGKNLELAELISSCESVSLHIRRQDYISDPGTYQTHGVCDIEYYQRCISRLVERVENPYFFIFGDEPSWARDNLNIPFPSVIIDNNGMLHSYEDLRLMSQCKHHIIANSSFSWWGAWLDQRTNKVVYAPRQWLKDTSHDSGTIIPAAWIKI